MNRATRVINAWADGEESLAGEVFTTLERELTAIARGRLRRDDRQGDAFETGDLISELFLKLDTDFRRHKRTFDRTEAFLAMVSKVMRQVLLDMGKKGGAAAPQRHDFTSIIRIDGTELTRTSVSVHNYYVALDRLKAKSPDLWQAIDLHYVFGYTLEECVMRLAELNERLDAEDARQIKSGKQAASRATFVRRLAIARQWMDVQLGRTI